MIQEYACTGVEWGVRPKCIFEYKGGWGVIGRTSGSISDYKYSKAMIAHGKEWSFEEMNSYLIKPQAHIKGTKMAFAGLRKEKDRASVILYMNSKSSSPKPLP